MGTDEAIFNDKAMLLIHNSNLDSLVQGMTSFSKEGMPFHIQSIESKLQEMMDHSRLSNEEKLILKFTMTSNKDQKRSS
ncbi:hypothetical protein HMSSN036_74640 [Paenibacillus macerans]|nr:hypothetical protein HMSSN036_74640 [Paenibacillus macerans]